MKKVGILTILFLVVFVIPGWASLQNWMEEKSASENYGDKAAGMFVRGIYRALEAPWELLYHLYDGTVNDRPYGVGTVKGLFMGSAFGAQKAALGAVDLVSAFVPGQHGLSREHTHGAASS